MLDLLLRAGLVLAGLAYLTTLLLSLRSPRPAAFLSLPFVLLAFVALAGDYFYTFLVPALALAWLLTRDGSQDAPVSRVLTIVPVCLGLAWFLIVLPDLGRFLPMLPADSPADSYDLARIVEDFQTNPVAVPLVVAYVLPALAALAAWWFRNREQGGV